MVYNEKLPLAFIFEDVFHQKPFHLLGLKQYCDFSIIFYDPSKLNSAVIQLQWFRLFPHILSVLAHCRDKQNKTNRLLNLNMAQTMGTLSSILVKENVHPQ